MKINTIYDIGEKVYIRNNRTKESIVEGEIVRISIYKGDAIKYSIHYISEDAHFDTDRWEDDLAKENLVCSACKKSAVVDKIKNMSTEEFAKFLADGLQILLHGREIS